MSDRAKFNMCFNYDVQGYLIAHHAKEKIINGQVQHTKIKNFNF